MNNNFLVITLNPFNYNQQISLHTEEDETSYNYTMDTVFEAALMIAETNGINNIKIATVSFPKEYSEEWVSEMKKIAATKYENYNFNFEVL